MLSVLEKIKEDIKKKGHRALIVVEDLNPKDFFKEIYDQLKEYKDFLIITDDKKDEDILEIKKLFNADLYEFKESDKLLGLTKDVLIFDSRRNITADDVGRAFEIVRGGGLIFLLIPEREEFENMITLYHKEVITPPYTLNHVKKLFNKWFYYKLLNHKGILIYNWSKKEIIKNYEGVDYIPKKKEIKIPRDEIIDKKIFLMAKTQDQVDAIKKISDAFKERKILLLIADRGRGKSAAIGLAIAAIFKYLNGKKFDIVVTARKYSNVKTLFEFFELGVKKLNLKVKKIKKGKYKYKNTYLNYLHPWEVLNRKKMDFLIVDEAAGIYINYLKKYTDKVDRIVFSSTIHGYEGAGRSFSVRFMKFLEEKFDFIKIELKEPIRYNENDPIEKFLYDVLLLDAEPPKLEENDIKNIIEKKNLKFQKLNLKELFKIEKTLREFVGIYVLAHYRNKPNDFLLLLDAPHHEGYALMVNNKVVVSIQAAKEGRLPSIYIEKMLAGESPKGNIIPDVICKHYREENFPKLKGLRIVRIATHPMVQDLGLGSEALKKLPKEDWIGSGFGVTYKLLKFWIKNEFDIVHLSPTKNPTTGEYSAIVLKGFSDEAKKIIKRIRLKFKEKLIDSLRFLYRDLESATVRLMLYSNYDTKENIILDDIDKKRLEAFIENKLIVDPNLDLIYRIAKQYFMLKKEIRDELDLKEKEEEMLIAIGLQGKKFKEIKSEYDFGRERATTLLRKGLKKLIKVII